MQSWDLDWVVPLEQETFPGDPPWSAGLFRSELAQVPETRWYGVAEDEGGDPVGYAGLRMTGYPGEPADLLTIAVAPAARGAGIGSALLETVFDEAAIRRAGAVLLEVRVDNARAIGFYERHGFAPLAVRRKYYADGTDGMVMHRRLLRSAAETVGNQR